jgi:hypothetical protein
MLMFFYFTRPIAEITKMVRRLFWRQYACSKFAPFDQALEFRVYMTTYIPLVYKDPQS